MASLTASVSQSVMVAAIDMQVSCSRRSTVASQLIQRSFCVVAMIHSDEQPVSRPAGQSLIAHNASRFRSNSKPTGAKSVAIKANFRLDVFLCDCFYTRDNASTPKRAVSVARHQVNITAKKLYESLKGANVINCDKNYDTQMNKNLKVINFSCEI